MHKRRILLVDDEVSITRALSLYLEEYGGCEVRVENAGSQALAAARVFRPDIIVMDLMMPDADGAALAAEMKSDPILQAIPVVFLTALFAKREGRSGPVEIAGHPFLAKPVDPEVVLEYVTRFARN